MLRATFTNAEGETVRVYDEEREAEDAYKAYDAEKKGGYISSCGGYCNALVIPARTCKYPECFHYSENASDYCCDACYSDHESQKDIID